MNHRGTIEPALITTAQRDALSLSTSDTAVIRNSTTGRYEAWNGTAWEPFIAGVTHVASTSGDPVISNDDINIPPPQLITRYRWASADGTQVVGTNTFITVNLPNTLVDTMGGAITWNASATRFTVVTTGLYRISGFARFNVDANPHDVAFGFTYNVGSPASTARYTLMPTTIFPTYAGNTAIKPAVNFVFEESLTAGNVVIVRVFNRDAANTITVEDVFTTIERLRT